MSVEEVPIGGGARLVPICAANGAKWQAALVEAWVESLPAAANLFGPGGEAPEVSGPSGMIASIAAAFAPQWDSKDPGGLLWAIVRKIIDACCETGIELPLPVLQLLVLVKRGS